MREGQVAYHRIIQEMIKQIQAGKLHKGDPLLQEAMLAKELSLSRSSVREAIRHLNTMGILDSRKGKGTFLVGDISDGLSDSIHIMLLLHCVSPKEVCQVRRTIELSALPMAFARREELDLDRLEELLEQIQLGNVLDSIRADELTHMWLTEASGNRLMKLMMHSIWEICSTQMNLILSDGTEELHQKQTIVHEKLYKSFLFNDLSMGIEAIQTHYDIIEQTLTELEERMPT